MKPSLLIVGLGNIGAQYEHTRHNVGFELVEYLRKHYDAKAWNDSVKFKALLSEGRIQTFPVLFCKPALYMNRSGESIHKLVEFYKLNPATQILMIYDDIDIPLGTTRIRSEGSAGTHNGVKSMLDSLGTNAISRIRIGIGPKPEHGDLASFVLSRVSAEEQKALDTVYKDVPAALEQHLYQKQPR